MKTPYKRAVQSVLLTVVILCILLSAGSLHVFSEEADISLSQSGTLKAGRNFYISVSANISMGALDTEISFDPDFIEFRSATADDSEDFVRFSQKDGKVSLIYSRTQPKSGTLFTIKLKALKNGETAVTVTPLSGIGSDERAFSFSNAHILSLTLGNNAGASASSTRRSSYRSSGSKSASSARSPSSSSGKAGDSDLSSSRSVSEKVVDFSRKDESILRPILIGSLSAFAVAALLTAGILIGRRTKKKPESNEPE